MVSVTLHSAIKMVAPAHEHHYSPQCRKVLPDWSLKGRCNCKSTPLPRASCLKVPILVEVSNVLETLDSVTVREVAIAIIHSHFKMRIITADGAPVDNFILGFGVAAFNHQRCQVDTTES